MRCDYILFTHLPKKNWNNLRIHAEDLIATLNGDPCGILIIFNDEGWLSLLNTVGADFDPIRLSKEFQTIEELKKDIQYVKKGWEHRYDDDDGCSRLRLITAADLFPIVNNIRGNKPGNEAVRLRRFLVSDEIGVFYDTAKVVEALIRIRHVGSGLPVIRIDWDALLNRVTLGNHLRASLNSVMKYCKDYANEPLINSSMLSGGYDQSRRSHDDWNLSDYNVAYATRVFPALIPSKKAVEALDARVSKDENSNQFIDCQLVDSINASEEENIRKATFKELEEWGMFNPIVVKSFYGERETESWSGIAELGSHPDNSVISGSLLVLSSGAILDLPPFSNFRRNVMWIDDHLKYLLHQSLGHFRRLELDVGGGGKRSKFTARVKEAAVYKDRVLAGQGNLRPYTLGVYIPTLFWGTILDAWIQPITKLKPPVISGLKPEKGPFTKCLGQVLRRGNFPVEDRNSLREALLKEAVIRAEAVRKNWKNLEGEEGKSFAALWVGGNRKEVQGVLDMRMQQQFLPSWIGWGLLGSKKTKIRKIEDMSVQIQEGIRVLVEDAIIYIDWALEWPSFVRSVRAVRNSSLTIDASFEPDNLRD